MTVNRKNLRRTRGRPLRFTVEIRVPAGLTVAEVRRYVEEAVGCWRGRLDPDDPLFNGLAGPVRVTEQTRAAASRRGARKRKAKGKEGGS